VRVTYYGKIAEQHNTTLLRNSALAGVLHRSLARRANVVNAIQIAGDRGLNVAEAREARTGHVDSILVELETDAGVSSVEGALVLDKPRLIQVDGIHCEAPLTGHLTFLRNEDVPGVVGFIGTIFGKNGINIANFSLGREQE